MALGAGSKLGPYEIVAAIGAGGMGQVYKARDPRLDRIVAIKVSTEQFSARFAREARAIAALNHPHVCQIYDIGPNYLVIEFVDGSPIAPVDDFEKLINIALQIVEGLAAAQARGIVHRDLKPGNILITSDGQVKILDFGLAQISSSPHSMAGPKEDATETMSLTRAGTALGTVAYMSPEQARGQTVDQRTDLWALGVVLYEMATGVRPFQGPTAPVVFEALLSKTPVPVRERNPRVPEELERIIGRLLEKDRDERYPSAVELRRDLMKIQEYAHSNRSVSDVGQYRSFLNYAAAAALVAVVWSGVYFWRARVHTQAKQPIAKQMTVTGGSSNPVVVSQSITGADASISPTAPSANPVSKPSAPLLTGEDLLVLADLTNTTGDPVFDGALRQALTFQIAESPFLKILDDEQVSQDLRLIGRAPGDRITNEIARDICVRERQKAFLGGSIAAIGKTYQLTLQARNCQTGETLAREYVEAQGKDQVLPAVDKAARGMRAKLGESLGSIQQSARFVVSGGRDLTTASLEAYRMFGLADAEVAKAKYADAIPYLKQATDVDPHFAQAFAVLGMMYLQARQRDLGEANIKKAFELVDYSSTQHERLSIKAQYYDRIKGDLIKAAEIREQVTHAYPRDSNTRRILGNTYRSLGQWEKALAEFQESARLEPRIVANVYELVSGYVDLDRFDEARAIVEKAVEQDVITPAAYHDRLLNIAYLQGDRTAADKESHWFVGKPEELTTLVNEARYLAFLHENRKSKDLYRRAAEMARGNNPKVVPLYEAQATAVVIVLKCEALADLDLLGGPVCFWRDNTKNLDEALKQRPEDTLTKAVRLPVEYAAAELKSGGSSKVLDLLQPATPYERSYPEVAYFRGLAYLRLGRGAEAAAQFQAILNSKGANWGSAYYQLSYFGLARSETLAHDTARARKAYEDFFAMAQDADMDDLYVLEARKQYTALR